MKQYSHRAPKVLGLVATLIASLHGSAVLADAMAEPTTSAVGQMCETDAARLARAVFSQQASSTLGASCERQGAFAASAQGHLSASVRSAPLTVALIVAAAPRPVGVEALSSPLSTTIGFEPANAQAPARPSSLAADGAGFDAYRRQGPLSTYGQDDAPVGPSFKFVF